ncbi:MAG: hypothetical protein EVJ46_08035 [Candidatus Acididesulfobacter guangdongensis]|uniref:Uncharacterized protein n=1 Tax=Acididesulfobacter guangdongensis TaxID=2597225 RepID=A0A519BFT8_ACIG2|nr:MAG: hypothetical protein EVJ46_08035 [Candidatus Acididesulfobacter guangdongensis]
MKIINLYNRLSISLESGIISGLFEEQFIYKLNSFIIGNPILRRTFKIKNKNKNKNKNTIAYFFNFFNSFNSFTYYYRFKKIFFLTFLFSVSILSIASPAYSYINLNQGSLGIGASGILNEATTWICYRLAPATLTLGLIKGFYDIKQHKPDAARKAFITAAAGTGVMLAPTITSAVLGIVQNAGGAANGITIGAGNGASTVGQP